ncbi:hypothetical protein BN2475_280117 [Paraburkholderia ribeironis]|uniref:Uncharacterized protein n=1 Tax=Paraburkholderia ribeironis TaxID=1247936 RepID=A0A1N7S1T5_9BURK|nr:hypothetical protein BN2475_280117 [Paraburkholderia ribeironis]
MPPGLRHADDTRPGYTRRREEGGFAYFDVSGKRIGAISLASWRTRMNYPNRSGEKLCNFTWVPIISHTASPTGVQPCWQASSRVRCSWR